MQGYVRPTKINETCDSKDRRLGSAPRDHVLAHGGGAPKAWMGLGTRGIYRDSICARAFTAHAK